MRLPPLPRAPKRCAFAFGALLSVAIVLAAPAEAKRSGGPDVEPLHRAGRWMVDADGRVFVGHGVNVVKKVAPFVRTEFGAADARLLADEGFTVARIGFIWEGVEPEPGKYDDGYIAKVIALNELLAKYGIRTVVDFHQDAWSQYTTLLSGDGAPKWATPSPNALDDFQAFWDNQAGPDGVGLQTHFVHAWQHVLTQFRTSHGFTNVLAWDPFNEPYAGSASGCPPFTPCPQFESGELAEFYRAIIPAMRASGGTQVIQPEAVADSGVVAPALPAFDDPQTAYHYHFYCNATQVSTEQTSVGDGSHGAKTCEPIETNNLGNYHSYTKGLGVPGFLGEFSCNDVNDDNAQVVDLTDEAFDSWTIWAYYTAADDPADCPGQGLLKDDKKPGSQDNAKQPKLDALAVPHAQAIAGTPVSTSLDRASHTFKLSYKASAVPGAALHSDLTQVFVPQRAYPKGYSAAVKGGSVVSAAGAPWLLVKAEHAGADVAVTVTPRKNGTTQRPLATGALPVATRTCSKRRSVRFRLPRGARRVKVTIGGHRVNARRKGRLLSVNLRRRSGIVRVRVTARTRHGQRWIRSRKFVLCRAQRGLKPSSGAAAVKIEVLSGRADLVSGADALVAVSGPRKALTRVKVLRDGSDVTQSFALRPDGRFEGLVTGLRDGKNQLTAKLPDGSGAKLAITNHPVGGPVFSGPQIQPWVCGTEAAGLGPATDKQCNAPTKISYQYKSSATGQFAAYDPASPPGDVATTTTDQGKAVRYIVRVEEGTQDRGLYQLAVLADPAKPWTAWAPQPAWNHKLLVPFGANTGPHHSQDAPTSVMDDDALSRGFMVADSGLNVQGSDANANVSAEALTMLKEHIAESYGRVRYTIGNGCSGGGLQQYMVASMYPGLLDGIQPNCSFADMWSTAPDVAECHFLGQYFSHNAQPWVPSVDGHKDPSDCEAWDVTFWPNADPTHASGCNLPQDQVYDPDKNPTGPRCTLQDYQYDIWGPRPKSEWGPVEKKIGRGFAEPAVGNVGVQYGLRALQSGQITPAEFADLNAKMGGIDIDAHPRPERVDVSDRTAEIAYRTGQITDARQLNDIPIMDLRGYSETGEIHTSVYSYTMRARLDRDNGNHANQIIWTWPAQGPIVLMSTASQPDIGLKSFLLIDKWLTNIEADHRSVPRAQKVRDDKPADAVDACFLGKAEAEITDPAQCKQLFPRYDTTRTAAGAPLANDIVKCQLKPLRREGYAGVTFTDAQWKQLQQAFPTGVCDYSKPSVAQQPSIPWMSFASGPGGEPLGSAPVSARLSACHDRVAPVSRFDLERARVSRRKLHFEGRSHDKGCGIDRVLVSVARVKGRTKHQRCAFLTPGRKLTRFRNCRKPVLLRARGTKKWRITLEPRHLPRGHYRVVVRAIDAAKNKERPRRHNTARFTIG